MIYLFPGAARSLTESDFESENQHTPASAPPEFRVMDQPACEHWTTHEDNVSIAVAGLRDGTYTTKKEAIAALGIVGSTLKRRLNGGLSSSEARERRRNLTPHEERELVEWITEGRAAGNKLAYSDMIERTREIRKRRLGGSATAVSKTWIAVFLTRHGLTKPKPYSAARKVSSEKVARDELVHFEQEQCPVPEHHDDVESANTHKAADTGSSFINFTDYRLVNWDTADCRIRRWSNLIEYTRSTSRPTAFG